MDPCTSTKAEEHHSIFKKKTLTNGESFAFQIISEARSENRPRQPQRSPSESSDDIPDLVDSDNSDIVSPSLAKVPTETTDDSMPELVSDDSGEVGMTPKTNEHHSEKSSDTNSKVDDVKGKKQKKKKGKALLKESLASLPSRASKSSGASSSNSDGDSMPELVSDSSSVTESSPVPIKQSNVDSGSSEVIPFSSTSDPVPTDDKSSPQELSSVRGNDSAKSSAVISPVKSECSETVSGASSPDQSTDTNNNTVAPSKPRKPTAVSAECQTTEFPWLSSTRRCVILEPLMDFLTVFCALGVYFASVDGVAKPTSNEKSNKKPTTDDAATNTESHVQPELEEYLKRLNEYQSFATINSSMVEVLTASHLDLQDENTSLSHRLDEKVEAFEAMKESLMTVNSALSEAQEMAERLQSEVEDLRDMREIANGRAKDRCLKVINQYQADDQDYLISLSANLDSNERILTKILESSPENENIKNELRNISKHKAKINEQKTLCIGYYIELFRNVSQLDETDPSFTYPEITKFPMDITKYELNLDAVFPRNPHNFPTRPQQQQNVPKSGTSGSLKSQSTCSDDDSEPPKVAFSFKKPTSTSKKMSGVQAAAAQKKNILNMFNQTQSRGAANIYELSSNSQMSASGSQTSSAALNNLNSNRERRPGSNPGSSKSSLNGSSQDDNQSSRAGGGGRPKPATHYGY